KISLKLRAPHPLPRLSKIRHRSPRPPTFSRQTCSLGLRKIASAFSFRRAKLVHTSLLQMLQPAAQAASRPATSSSSSATSSSSSSSSAPGVDLTQTFLQLLSVQLENQSPMNPVDPNQFVTQLATFDSLGELTQIQSLMQTLVNDVNPTASAASGDSVNARANSTSTPSVNSISH